MNNDQLLYIPQVFAQQTSRDAAEMIIKTI